MSEIECKRQFESAIDSLCELDHYLLRVDASERSISHRLAMHLTSRFPNFDVDCEYNRAGFDVKRLKLRERTPRDDELEAVTVFPDIVVHKRGNNESNLLVVEMKKSSSNVSSDYDFEKLRAFVRELGYKYSVHCTIGYDRSGALIRDIVWVSAEYNFS